MLICIKNIIIKLGQNKEEQYTLMIIDWKENAEHLDNMAIHEYTINFFFFIMYH